MTETLGICLETAKPGKISTVKRRWAGGRIGIARAMARGPKLLGGATIQP
jgi:hypothetical protein